MWRSPHNHLAALLLFPSLKVPGHATAKAVRPADTSKPLTGSEAPTIKHPTRCAHLPVKRCGLSDTVQEVPQRESDVGSTKNALHIRLNGRVNGHRYDIKKYDIGKKKTQKSVVAKHFNRRGHSMDDLTVMVIQRIPEGDVQTKIGCEKHERKWIGKLHTLHPCGMNR